MLVGVKIEPWPEVLLSCPRLPSSQPLLGTLSSLQQSTLQNIPAALLPVCLPTLLLHKGTNVYAWLYSNGQSLVQGVIQVVLVLSFTSRCGLGQGTFVIITRLGGVETEDSYCHQGINKGKKEAE